MAASREDSCTWSAKRLTDSRLPGPARICRLCPPSIASTPLKSAPVALDKRIINSFSCCASNLVCFHFGLVSLLRDGRTIKMDAKPRSQLAIDRFVGRSGGFASAASETTLAEVGLESLAPSNYQRT